MERNSMKLELNLELKTNDVVVGQSIPMLLTLKNKEKKSQKLPFLIDSGTVTNFILFNEKKEMINEFNGVTIALNEGMPPDLTVSMVELGKGDSWNWDVDLLAYQRSFAVGKYYVQAVYRYADLGIEIESEKEELIVNPNQPVFMDVLQDQVMVKMLYLVQTNKIDKSDEEEILFNMGYNSKPGSFLFGSTLKLGSGIQPTISKVDFVNAMDFDHDTYRWLAWEQDKSVYLSSVFRNELKVDPKEVIKNVKNGSLVRRPIQHQDKGVSIFIYEETGKNKYAVIRIDFDEEANEISREEIISLDYKPEPITVSASFTGEYHLTWCEDGHPPVYWLKIDPMAKSEKSKGKGKSKGKTKFEPVRLFPAEDEKSEADPDSPIPEIIFLEPYLPLGDPTNHSVLLMTMSEEKEKKGKKKEKDIGLKIDSFRIMIESDNRDVISGSSILIEGEIKKLIPANGHLIQNQDLSLIGIIGTADGGVYYISPPNEVSKLMDIEPELIPFSNLVLGGKGGLDLFYLKCETGINIYTLIRRQL
jgi:hypothetical protein